MTLIISVVTHSKAVQASDRRLTWEDKKKPNLNKYDDDNNKAICVYCTDAHFAMAYTGIARIGPRLERTDKWITDYLASIKADTMDLVSIGEVLKSRIEEHVRRTPIRTDHAALSVVMA